MLVPVPDRQPIEGNHVLLNCENFLLLLAHFRPGSVLVQVGDHVAVGDQLGLVGNSGNTTEPHLHISAQFAGTPEEPLSGEPLPLAINGRYVVRNSLIRLRPL